MSFTMSLQDIYIHYWPKPPGGCDWSHQKMTNSAASSTM